MKKLLLLSVAVASSLMANTVAQEAKDAGLAPIPSDKKALMKLIDNPNNPITDAKVELGKQLYFDPRLSKSGFISCNSCHNLSEGGDDGLEAAIGHKWTVNPHHLNSPTVYNSVFNSIQFWDGRSPHLEDQAQGPMQAAPEMAATKEHVAAVVSSMPEYVSAFKKIYGDDVKIDLAKVADTIAVFERTLVTPSRYDDFLNGDAKALTNAEQEGLKTFIQVGCTTCHTGVGLGGELNVFNAVNTYKYNNVGDFKGDANGMVRVPTLRNITQTGPYFHNGMMKTLPAAIKEMGRVQLGLDLSDKQVSEIETFLKALDGRKPAITMPILPASTDKTPLPDIN
ncbi:cytochrome-c peroxidase [Sulfurimonas sp. C5]|uniref:cytochrome-c peroxidase n=1 Tax=Sulfurimonas sp. C5 TaxID=3036947 RepID=UPI0024589B9D|nr:cytochrome-c peroxidase [Sulfurimonas sp. C5]MDH4943722.1 cytochrome-c peroxidase [Sulfurimonas sp. C5]